MKKKALSLAAVMPRVLNNTCYSLSIVVIIAAVMTDSRREDVGCFISWLDFFFKGPEQKMRSENALPFFH